ncbi:MAG: hypothetical protein NDI73_12345 [Desulfuromonadales bacterium]|nr:hypothetical protein [Desulfuromonadales bacterium]
MSRIIACVLLFVVLIMSGGLSLADTFKCTRPDGSVFYTDDPAQVPSGCAIERVKEPPPIGIIPEPPLKQPLVPGVEGPVTPPPQASGTRPFDSFKNEAAQLFEEYQAARHKVVQTSFVADEQVARRELFAIKARASDLRSEINQSSLSGSEKRELEVLLSPITE